MGIRSTAGIRNTLPYCVEQTEDGWVVIKGRGYNTLVELPMKSLRVYINCSG